MLAEFPMTAQAGRLEPEVQMRGTARLELIDFIADELPHWRDHPQRKAATSEKTLTEQLCSHLNSAARFSEAWSRLQFRTEITDEGASNRSIDLAPQPCGALIVIEGRRHTQFDMLFPIECKRLPTPIGDSRDPREYVVTAKGTTGGIQRFKFGHHGAAHRVAVMIGYVQEKAFDHWVTQINKWIEELSSGSTSNWTMSDCLKLMKTQANTHVCRLTSTHKRRSGTDDIALLHLWINMA
jgi:hypothetical protein